MSPRNSNMQPRIKTVEQGRKEWMFDRVAKAIKITENILPSTHYSGGNGWGTYWVT